MITITVAVCLAAVGIAALILMQVRTPNRFELLEGFLPGARIKVNQARKSRVRRTFNKSATWAIDSQLPDLVTLLAVSIRGGETLQSAMIHIASRSQGEVSQALKQLCTNLDLGSTFDTELKLLCQDLPTSGVRDLCNKLAIALNRGTPLAQSLENLAQSLRRRSYNELLAHAGANETKMMIPLVTLVLPVTVLFALFPSSGVLQFQL